MKITIEIDTESKIVKMSPNTKTKCVSEDITNMAEMISFTIFELPDLFGNILGRYAKNFGLNESCMEACANRFVIAASDAFNRA